MPADGKYWDGEAINPYPLFLLMYAAAMTLSSKERAELRAEAHHLTPIGARGASGTHRRAACRRSTTRSARASW